MIELTLEQEKLICRVCIEEGIDLQYGKLSLCDLRNYRYSYVKYRRYQVHCEDQRYEHSMIYDDLDAAVNKFIEIKKFVKKEK